MKVASLFSQENLLPTAPKVVQELIESFSKDDLTIEELSDRIALDPVLSANLLRLANSAYYRASRQIGSVEAAVTMLGFVTVRTLVITCSLVSRFKSAQGIDLRQFWRYSLTTAVVCQWLARQCGEDEETAFTLGVIHAIGELMMHLGIPEEVTTLGKIVHFYADTRLQTEKDVFGFHYLEVSAELLGRWKFPDSLIAALRASSRRFDPESFDRLGAILHLSSGIARASERDGKFEAGRTALPAAVLTLLNLTAEALSLEMPSLDELRGGLENLLPY